MSAWNPGGVILGEYLIEKELGRGGMGRVWLVKSQSTGRRFAVKQALIRDEKHRKAFLTELQTWIDLPEHPNIVPCRFFRTVGDEIVIFADYIEGGSLADWIAKGKLTGLEQILDVAIQFAWGLHAIHERGLIHQDVKPGNVLMTPEGVPMVTDFGLARARLRAADGGFVSPALLPGQHSVLVSSGGMTPAYASPEQRSGKRLSWRTDLWSWGVSVLEMFTGGVTWQSGHLAGAVLDQYVEDADMQAGVVITPRTVKILRGCFQDIPSLRWASLVLVVEHLKDEYFRITGNRYHRELCRTYAKTELSMESAERRTICGAEWADPRIWLEYVLAVREGREGQSIGCECARRSRSHLGNLVEDLALFERVREEYQLMIDAGRHDLEIDLANMSMEKALVHHAAGDHTGAIAEYDCAIRAWRKSGTRDNPTSAVLGVAASVLNKSVVVRSTGDLAGSMALIDEATKMLVDSRTQNNFPAKNECDMLLRENHLGVAFLNKCATLMRAGRNREALKAIDTSIAIWMELDANGSGGPYGTLYLQEYLASAEALKDRLLQEFLPDSCDGWFIPTTMFW